MWTDQLESIRIQFRYLLCIVTLKHWAYGTNVCFLDMARTRCREPDNGVASYSSEKFQLKQCGSAPAKREAFENKKLEDLLYMKTCDALRDGEGGHPPTFDYHLFLKVSDLSDFIDLDKCDENRLNDSYKCKRLEKEIRRFPLGNLLVLEV